MENVYFELNISTQSSDKVTACTDDTWNTKSVVVFIDFICQVYRIVLCQAYSWFKQKKNTKIETTHPEKLFLTWYVDTSDKSFTSSSCFFRFKWRFLSLLYRFEMCHAILFEISLEIKQNWTSDDIFGVFEVSPPCRCTKLIHQDGYPNTFFH